MAPSKTPVRFIFDTSDEYDYLVNLCWSEGKIKFYSLRQAFQKQAKATVEQFDFFTRKWKGVSSNQKHISWSDIDWRYVNELEKIIKELERAEENIYF